MKYKHIIYILFLFAFYSGCRKDESPKPSERPVGDYRLPEDFKRYFFFKPGSYWIYLNEQTGDIDSEYVIKADSNVFRVADINDPQKTLYYMEKVGEVWHSDYYGTNYVATAAGVNNDLPGVDYSANLWSSLWGGGRDYLFFYNFDVKDTMYYGTYARCYIKTLVDTIKIGNDTVNCTTFRSDDCSFYYQSASYISMAKNIGVVRKTDEAKKHTWRLLRYKTIY